VDLGIDDRHRGSSSVLSEVISVSRMRATISGSRAKPLLTKIRSARY
jgi:hypothetical protein